MWFVCSFFPNPKCLLGFRLPNPKPLELIFTLKIQDQLARIKNHVFSFTLSTRYICREIQRLNRDQKLKNYVSHVSLYKSKTYIFPPIYKPTNYKLTSTTYSWNNAKAARYTHMHIIASTNPLKPFLCSQNFYI